MAAATVKTGYASYVKFGWETTYGTASVDIDKIFGRDCKYTIRPNRNMQKTPQLASQEYHSFSAGKYEGSIELDMKITSGWWIPAATGVADITSVAWDDTSGSGPYTRSQNFHNELPSMTVVVGDDLDTDSICSLLGVGIQSMRITATQDADVRATVTGIYKTESDATSTYSAPTDTEASFNMGMATLTIGSAVDLLKSVNVEIIRNTKLVHGLGSLFANQLVAGQRDMNAMLELPYTNAELFYHTFLGDASAPYTPQTTIENISNVQLTLSNGGAGTDERSMNFYFQNGGIEEHERNGQPGSEELGEGVNIALKTAKSNYSVVYVNNTETAP